MYRAMHDDEFRRASVELGRKHCVDTTASCRRPSNGAFFVNQLVVTDRMRFAPSPPSRAAAPPRPRMHQGVSAMWFRYGRINRPIEQGIFSRTFWSRRTAAPSVERSDSAGAMRGLRRLHQASLWCGEHGAGTWPLSRSRNRASFELLKPEPAIVLRAQCVRVLQRPDGSPRLTDAVASPASDISAELQGETPLQAHALADKPSAQIRAENRSRACSRPTSFPSSSTVTRTAQSWHEMLGRLLRRCS